MAEGSGGRIWVVGDPGERNWEVKTAQEMEVYYRPLDANGKATGGWRAGLPPIKSSESLPWSLREVLELMNKMAKKHASPSES